MSLSKDIIEGNLEELKRRLSLGASVNDHDPYGYTPLIMSIMTKQPEVCRWLLERGADPNAPDLFGQPPLHWAIRVESLEMIDQLLNRYAFPNTVSAYGEPLLVYPLLKKQKDITERLLAAGTNKTSAQDYILTKTLGHHFDLKGFGLFKNYNFLIYPVDYQGFRLEFSLFHLKNQFESALLAQRYESSFGKNILEILSRACQLRTLKQNIGQTEISQNFINLIDEYNLIPMAFDGHAVSMVWSAPYLAICDRSRGRSYTAAIFKLARQPSYSDLHLWLYGSKDRRYFESIPDLFGGKMIHDIKISQQISGNCSWANLEPSIVLIEAVHDLKSGGLAAVKSWQDRYEFWSQWNKMNMLNQAFSHFASLEGDRALALKMTFLNILVSAELPSKAEEKILELLASERPLIEHLVLSHQKEKTLWTKKIQEIQKKLP